MAKAIWNDTVIAQSDVIEEVEGNMYFPPDSVKTQFLKESNTKTTCKWKGEARYYNIDVDGMVNEDAAWCYPEPKPEAEHIKGFFAFWKGVKVEK